MSWLGIVQFAGYAFTPILGGIPVQWTVAGAWVVDTFVAGTYVVLLLDAVLMAALWYGMNGEGKEEEAVTEGATAVTSTAEEFRVDVAEQCAPDHSDQRLGKAGYATVDVGDVLEEAVDRGEEPQAAQETCGETIPNLPTPSVRRRTLSSSARRCSIPTMSPSGRSLRVTVPAPVTPTSLHSAVRSFSATASHSSTVFHAPTPTGRRLSAPAVMDPRSLVRGASPVPLSGMRSPEPPSLIRASWRSSPLFTPVLFVCLNATCRGCLAVAETYGSILFYTTSMAPGKTRPPCPRRALRGSSPSWAAWACSCSCCWTG